MPTLTHEQWILVVFGIVLFVTFWMTVAALARPTVAAGSNSTVWGAGSPEGSWKDHSGACDNLSWQMQLETLGC